MIVIAVVPAKSRSRRVPGKNIKNLAGAPLFLHSVSTALRSEIFDEVFVSSDDNRVLTLARDRGATAIAREPELCADTATNFDVLVSLLKQLRASEIDPDIIVMLQPTTPFRSPSALSKMVRVFGNSNADSAVTHVRRPRCRGHVHDGLWRGELPGPGRSQRIKADVDVHEITGHVYLMRPPRTLDLGMLLGERVLPLQLPESWLDIDIDTKADWILAEAAAQVFQWEDSLS